jgi:hypothetical protein
MSYHIAHALAYLYPDADPREDYQITSIDGVESIAVWNLPDPQPTPEQLQIAADAYLAEQAAAATEASALRTLVLNLATSAVGKTLNTLTAGEVRALMAILLWQAGGVTGAGVVRPLVEWVQS